MTVWTVLSAASERASRWNPSAHQSQFARSHSGRIDDIGSGRLRKNVQLRHLARWSTPVSIVALRNDLAVRYHQVFFAVFLPYTVPVLRILYYFVSAVHWQYCRLFLLYCIALVDIFIARQHAMHGERDIVLANQSVSPLHCNIVYNECQWCKQDQDQNH